MANSQTENKPLSFFTEELIAGSRPRGGVRGITSGVPSIGGEHLNSQGGFNFSNIKYVSKSFAQSMRRGSIKQQDVLIVKDGATTGKVSFIDKNFPFDFATINEHVFILRPNKEILPKFLFWYLWSFNGQTEIKHNFQGSAQGGINRSFLEGVSVPIFDKKYQELVLSKIDYLIPQLWNEVSRIEITKNKLSKFRQSVLSAAVSGRLTEDWRNINKTVKLSEVILKKQKDVDQSEYVLVELPREWIYSTLGEFASFKYGTSEKSDYKFKGIPVLRIPNISTGNLQLADLKFLSSIVVNESYLVKNGDILIIRSNGSRDLVGKNSIVRNIKEEFAFASYLIKISTELLFPEYIWLFLNSQLAKRQLFSKAKSAAGVNNINSRELSSLIVPIPPVEEQKEIVKRVNAMFELADKVEKQVNSAAQKVEKLTQSILAKAFRGEL